VAIFLGKKKPIDVFLLYREGRISVESCGGGIEEIFHQQTF
jgi:hypothetical protein